MVDTHNRLRSALEGFGFAFLGCLSSWYLIGLFLSLFFATLSATPFLWFGGIAGLLFGTLIFIMAITMYSPDGVAES
ncbi:hypothetical protein [Telluribacter sp. SYSU D00476]|uniref:hypothetical protein n=1 Tax=Telluribacter sp. SYSU D00476 TaxID=2811430 RepID=UPI001FF413B0|nr:hypothetical protein [Telluribacter sp. SYSU D00476]